MNLLAASYVVECEQVARSREGDCAAGRECHAFDHADRSAAGCETKYRTMTPPTTVTPTQTTVEKAIEAEPEKNNR